MKTRVVHILLIVLLLSGLCACGPRQKKSVKIALTLPFDAEEGAGIAWPIRHAMELALEEADYKAGDFAIELEVWNSADEEGMPLSEKEVEYAEQAAADEDVLVYMGSLSSSGCKDSIPILNRAGVPQMSVTATYPGLTKLGFEAGEPAIYYPSGERTFFRLCTTDDMQGPAAALWAKDLGLESVYIVEQNDLFGQGLATTFRQTAEANGIVIVGSASTEQNQQTGLEEVVAEIIDQQAGLVYQAGFDGTGIALVRSLRAEGSETRVMGPTLYTSDLIEEVGADVAEGALSTFEGVAREELNQATQDFIRRFEERFGYELGGRAFWAALSYDAMGIALAAIERAGEADRAAVLKTMRETDYEGVLGRWGFDENGDTRLPLVTGFHVEDGEWKSDGLLRVR